MRWFGLGPGEIILVCLIALLLFGRRIPELLQQIGRGISEFEDGLRRERRFTHRTDPEAEKQAEDFANRMDRLGRAVAFFVGAVLVGAVLAYLLRDFSLF